MTAYYSYQTGYFEALLSLSIAYYKFTDKSLLLMLIER